MRRNNHHQSHQEPDPYFQQQQSGYDAPPAEYIASAFYPHQQYLNPHFHQPPHDMQPPYAEYDPRHQGFVYQGYQDHPGAGNFGRSGPHTESRGRGRGQRGRGRGRGYQSQGRHKRFTDDQNRDHNFSGASQGRSDNDASLNQRGVTEGADQNQPVFYFNESKDHDAGDEEDKSFADTVGQEKKAAERKPGSRGGRSYSLGSNRQRGGGNKTPSRPRNGAVREEGDEAGGGGVDLKVAQREARQKLSANQKRRQVPPGDDEDDDGATPPEPLDTQEESGVTR